MNKDRMHICYPSENPQQQTHKHTKFLKTFTHTQLRLTSVSILNVAGFWSRQHSHINQERFAG